MCKWYEMDIRPRDILFFCGAKPMGGSAMGEGANWPMPSVFHQALLSAFQTKWPNLQRSWEHDHQFGADKSNARSFRFGGLKTVGVFPEREELYFPMPSDVQFRNSDSNALCILEPRKLQGVGNLPRPLEMGLFRPTDGEAEMQMPGKDEKDGTEGNVHGPPLAEATKREPNRWISFSDLLEYLAGESLMHRDLEPLFDTEARPGIGIDPQTGTADTGGDNEGGKFFLAEYLRLRKGVFLKAFGACEQVRYRDEKAPVDVLDKFFDGGNASFIFGGQRGLAYLNGIRDSQNADNLLYPQKIDNCRFIKWVTLTPSIFIGGWLPSWIDKNTGTITASAVTRPERRPGDSRKAWRSQFIKRPVPGRLVAASIPNAVPYSGWRDHGGEGTRGPRTTRLCVPAGAVYYFEVPEGEAPDELIRFLSGRRKSDIAAEKGFGFGLCGIWKK